MEKEDIQAKLSEGRKDWIEYKNEWRVRLGDWVLGRSAWGEKKHGMFMNYKQFNVDRTKVHMRELEEDERVERAQIVEGFVYYVKKLELTFIDQFCKTE